MKNVSFVFLALLMSVSTYAATCRDTFAEKDQARKETMGYAGLIAVLSAPIIFITVPVLGGYWIVFGKKPGRMVKLIDQARACKGKLINKAYSAYNSQENDGLDKLSFCNEIMGADLNGGLCAGDVPSVKQIGNYYID